MPANMLSSNPPSSEPTATICSGDRQRALVRALVAVLAILVVSCACEVRTTVDVELERDGTGEVFVGAGFDDEALERLGDPTTQLALDDLAGAGWAVEAPAVEDDGFTWVRASKPFASPADLEAVLLEVSGDPTVFSDVDITAVEGDDATTYSAGFTVDLSGGLAVFADDDLAATLGGDPFGGLVTYAEEANGRPVTEQFQIAVALDLDGETDVVLPTLGAPAERLEVISVVEKPSVVEQATGVALWVALALLAGVGLVAALTTLRRRFRSAH